MSFLINQLLVLAISMFLTPAQIFNRNLVAISDVVNWEDNTAMNDATIKILDQTGQVLESYKNIRFKLSNSVAFTKQCIWVGAPRNNPNAKAEPELPLSIHQSISCINKKTGIAKDTFIEGLLAERPSNVSDNTGVIFGSSSKSIIVLAHDDGSIKILDLKTINPEIDLALKTPYNYFHTNGSYYQTTRIGSGKTALIKVSEKDLSVQQVVYFNTAIGELFYSHYGIFATGYSSKSKIVYQLNKQLKIIKTSTNNPCFKLSTTIGVQENTAYIIDRVNKELRTFNFTNDTCKQISKTPPGIYTGAIKKDVIYFDRGIGQTSLLVYNLKTKAWTEIPAGKSVDWVQ